ncbi:MAG: DUF2975 domain-containing protein [Tannerella sp.]|jgi:hypothetical protein|nr:DUF2975 domain-containing protein [Tannerella sp.]
MKKRLNLITLIIGIAAGISIWSSMRDPAFMEGYKDGRIYSENEEFEGAAPLVLMLNSKKSAAMPEKIFNIKTGEWIPVRMLEAIVSVPVHEHYASYLILTISVVIFFITGFLMIVFNFAKMIISVNKSVIFDWINVKRLRRIGIGFILLFAVSAGYEYYYNHLVRNMIDLENYNIVTSSLYGNYLIFGMTAILLGEIFAVGLRLKEEQDLTV